MSKRWRTLPKGSKKVDDCKNVVEMEVSSEQSWRSFGKELIFLARKARLAQLRNKLAAYVAVDRSAIHRSSNGLCEVGFSEGNMKPGF